MGKTISGTYNAGSVWKTEGTGQWLAIFHTNVKQARHGNPMYSLTFAGRRSHGAVGLHTFDASLTSQGPALFSIQQWRGSRNG